MPSFEIYQRQESPKDTVPAQQMGYGAVEALNQAGQQSAQTIDYIGKTWEEAEYQAQYTTAKNNLNAQMMQFDEDFRNVKIDGGASGDFFKTYAEKKTEYANKLTAIKQNASTLTNPRARAQYAQDAEIASARGSVLLESAFRDKMIAHQQVELQRSQDVNKRLYVAGQTPAKAEYLKQLEGSQMFLSEQEMYKMKEAVRGWDADRIQSMAAVDSQMALAELEKTDYSNEEKAAVKSHILSIQKSKDIETELAMLTRYQSGQKNVANMFADTSKTYLDKQNALDEMMTYGDIDKETYDTFSLVNRSADRLTAKTVLETKGQLVREIEMFASSFTADKLRDNISSTKDFLQGQKALANKIASAYGKKNLTEADFAELSQALLSKNSMPAKMGATQEAIRTEAQTPQYGLSKQIKKIDTSIGSVTKRNEIIAAYYDYIRKDLSSGDEKKQKENEKYLADLISKAKRDQLQSLAGVTMEERKRAVAVLEKNKLTVTDERIAHVVSRAREKAKQ